MCHYFSFFSLKSFSITHLAWLSPLSRGQEGSQHMLVQEKDVCLLPTLPPHTHHKKQKQKCYTDSPKSPVCKLQSSSGFWRHVGNTQIRKTAPSLTPCSQGQSLQSPWMFLVWSECDLLASLPIALQKRSPGTQQPPGDLGNCWNSVSVYFIFIALPMHARSLLRAKQMDQPKSLTRRRWWKWKS